MLKKWLNKFAPPPRLPRASLTRIPRDAHCVSRKKISASALKVLYRLNDHGYEAFLVGGGVRDLLLGLQPKDFDIATNATPEQVREVFRNCRLIGRRFRLAHIHFGREIIEVATFRGHHDEGSDKQGRTGEQGQIVRDNVYGSQSDDAVRRDFTINALYYSVKDFSVYDFTTGMEDLENRCIRMIGDPATRYREDPVRMLRAVRFAAKLDCHIHPQTAAPITELAPLLRNVASARLFDEVLKLLMTGHGLASLEGLEAHGLLELLLPGTTQTLRDSKQARALVSAALENTDRRIAAGKPVSPAFLYASLLWPVVSRDWQALRASEHLPPLQSLHEAAQAVINEQALYTTIPKRFSIPMREIWEQQWRLGRKPGRRASERLSHPRFRAGFDLLRLREAAGEETGAMARYWTEYQEQQGLDPDNSPAAAESPESPARRRRRRRRRRPAADTHE